MVRNRLSILQDIRRYGGGCHASIGITYGVDTRDVCNVRDVSDIPNVGDIHLLQVLHGVVIPREERLTGSQREPRGQTHADTNRKSGPSDKSNERRRIER